jgi:hypothetical protein
MSAVFTFCLSRKVLAERMRKMIAVFQSQHALEYVNRAAWIINDEQASEGDLCLAHALLNMADNNESEHLNGGGR